MKIRVQCWAARSTALCFAACAVALPGAFAQAPGSAAVSPANQTAPAAMKPAQPAQASAPQRNDPAAPAIKGADDPSNPWLQRHEGFVAIAKQGHVDLLFLGDSITDGWRGGGREVWQREFAPLHAANFGIGGDRVEHVLWRVLHGEIDGISPKVAVVMIGTNNLGANSDAEIAKGVGTLVHALQEKLPQTKVLLLGVFPRGLHVADGARARIKAINATISKLDDGKTVRYLDIGDAFLESDGTLPKRIMPDALHPNAKGYEIWAEAMKPLLQEMLK